MIKLFLLNTGSIFPEVTSENYVATYGNIIVSVNKTEIKVKLRDMSDVINWFSKLK